MLTLFTYWYLESAQRFYSSYVHTLGTFESQIAIRETAQHITEPLFQDYTIQGRAIGFCLRLVRIGIGLFGLLILSVGYCFLYLLWLVFPLICLISLVASFAAPSTSSPMTNLPL